MAGEKLNLPLIHPAERSQRQRPRGGAVAAFHSPCHGDGETAEKVPQKGIYIVLGTVAVLAAGKAPQQYPGSTVKDARPL